MPLRPDADLGAAISGTCGFLRRIAEEDELREKFMGTPKDLHETIRSLAELKELCSEGSGDDAAGVIILAEIEEEPVCGLASQ